MKLVIALLVFATACSAQEVDKSKKWIVYEGGEGPGKGKHIVLLAGDEEYRSEEAMPMLGKILAKRHGFKCTVLFSTNPETNEIDPNNQTHVPGLHLLKEADLAIVFFRFRELPDEDMKHFDEFTNSGKPVIGIRTSTHAFRYNRNRKSPYAKYSFRNKAGWTRGWGGEVLGDTWINHHGHHGRQSTRGVIEEENKDHPILEGVKDIWGPTDVYGIRNLPANSKVLVRGAVIENMKPEGKPVADKKNDPMMPLIWVREYTGSSGKTSRVMCTTMGSSTDFASAGLRRVCVNACYWGLGMEDEIPAESNVDVVGTYEPTPFGFNRFKKGVWPAHHAMK